MRIVSPSSSLSLSIIVIFFGWKYHPGHKGPSNVYFRFCVRAYEIFVFTSDVCLPMGSTVMTEYPKLAFYGLALMHLKEKLWNNGYKYCNFKDNGIKYLGTQRQRILYSSLTRLWYYLLKISDNNHDSPLCIWGEFWFKFISFTLVS